MSHLRKLGSQICCIKKRKIKSPEDAYQLLKPFQVDSNCEQLIFLTLDTKNQPTAVHTVSVGILNSSLGHSKEVGNKDIVVVDLYTKTLEADRKGR